MFKYLVRIKAIVIGSYYSLNVAQEVAKDYEDATIDKIELQSWEDY